MRHALRTLLLVIGTLSLAAVASAAGTATVTTSIVDAGNGSAVYQKISIVWVSTAGGAVSGNAFTVLPGRLVSVRITPGTSTLAPTDLYDITLSDGDVADLLVGAGADLSNTASMIAQWDPPLAQDGSRTLDLVVANAGDANGGTVVILVQIR